MSEVQQLQIIAEAMERYARKKGRPIIIESTAAAVVHNVAGPLYNVDGSSRDPKLGASWKVLFTKTMGKSAFTNNCYVGSTTPVVVPPAGSSHPDFRVGGHMTQNSNGQVTNKTCYLMPLCSWHNSKARDQHAFALVDQNMVELTGYMTAEPAKLFEARLDGKAVHAIVYETEDGTVDYRTFDEEPDPARQMLLENASVSDGKAKPDTFVQLRRTEYEGRTVYEVTDSGARHLFKAIDSRD